MLLKFYFWRSDNTNYDTKFPRCSFNTVRFVMRLKGKSKNLNLPFPLIMVAINLFRILVLVRWIKISIMESFCYILALWYKCWFILPPPVHPDPFITVWWLMSGQAVFCLQVVGKVYNCQRQDYKLLNVAEVG